ncbi:MAG: beta-lactamase family protein [Planctomycetes bacterium]|nr:beta-lactamase family protein [Planctomycetota bacterium]
MNPWRRILCLAFLFSCVLVRAEAEENLSELLEPIRERNGLPALAGAIVTGDGAVATGATGVRRLGSPERVTTTDRWHLGSCTKAMTATMLASLVERGRLSWDATLAELYPELAGGMDTGYRDVTLYQLLRHRGGTPEDLSPGGLWTRLWGMVEEPPMRQRRALVEGVLARPPASRPGVEYLYSNAGYAIAGHAAERAEHDPWEILMLRELLGPLGMESAGFGPPGEPNELSEPRGHRETPEGPKPVEPGPLADNPPAIGPAGTLHVTTSDWAKFVALHLAAASGSPRLLSAESFRRLQVPPEGEEYACGWLATERDWADGPVLTHAGSNTMWYCVVWIAPRKGFAVLACTNRGGEAAAAGCDQAAWAMIQRRLEGK